MSRALSACAYGEYVDELADSGGLIDDAAGLRRRLADDGYLFFRGLLPAAQVSAIGQAVLGVGPERPQADPREADRPRLDGLLQ